MKNYQRFFPVSGLIALVALLVTTVSLPAAEAPKAVQKTLDKLLDAIKANDRKAFIEDATEAVKEGITPQLMENLQKQLGSRLEKGYEAAYLCRLNQAGHQVHLWKLTFKDEGDDVVIRLALKDGKVAGFFLQ